MKGQTVCRTHGGAASQNRAAAARRRAEERALEILAARGSMTPVDNPFEELARVAGEILAVKDYLGYQVDSLNGVLTHSYASGEFGGLGQVKEDVRAVVAAYERALDRCVKILAVMGKMDLDGRMLAFNQARADLIVGAVERGLAACDLPPVTLRIVKGAVADEFEKLSERRKTSEYQAGT